MAKCFFFYQGSRFISIYLTALLVLCCVTVAITITDIYSGKNKTTHWIFLVQLLTPVMMDNASDLATGSKTKAKEMTLTQAMSCLEVAMKWSSGFKKVTRWSETTECLDHVQDISVDTFTEEDLRGAMKSEIDTLGICSKFLIASKINFFFFAFNIIFVLSGLGNFTKYSKTLAKRMKADLQLMNVMRKENKEKIFEKDYLLWNIVGLSHFVRQAEGTKEECLSHLHEPAEGANKRGRILCLAKHNRWGKF